MIASSLVENTGANIFLPRCTRPKLRDDLVSKAFCCNSITLTVLYAVVKRHILDCDNSLIMMYIACSIQRSLTILRKIKSGLRSKSMTTEMD